MTRLDGGLPALWPKIAVVLFDVEGTLVDAVPLTLQCWQVTLREFGHMVRKEVLQCLSGMDSRDMLARLLPRSNGKLRQRIVHRQGELFRSRYLARVEAIAGAAELLRALRTSGRKIGIATDCSSDELRRYLQIAAVGKFIDKAACGSETRHGKPHAGLVRLVLRKLRARPAAALLIGDTPQDAEAARRAGASAVGVLTGGFRRRDLEAAGCYAVFRDLESLRCEFQRISLAKL